MRRTTVLAVLASLVSAHPGQAGIHALPPYNPLAHRRARAMSYLMSPRRMHNKSFTVDNRATVVGGRNVGDEYIRALHETTLVQELLADRLELEWDEVRLVCDDPAKTLDTQHRRDLLLLPRMLELMGRPTKTHGPGLALLRPLFGVPTG